MGRALWINEWRRLLPERCSSTEKRSSFPSKLLFGMHSCLWRMISVQVSPPLSKRPATARTLATFLRPSAYSFWTITVAACGVNAASLPVELHAHPSRHRFSRRRSSRAVSRTRQCRPALRAGSGRPWTDAAENSFRPRRQRRKPPTWSASTRTGRAERMAAKGASGQQERPFFETKPIDWRRIEAWPVSLGTPLARGIIVRESGGDGGRARGGRCRKRARPNSSSRSGYFD
jgi:hypothetical protein